MELYTGQNLVVKFVVKTSSYLTKLSFAMIFEMPVLCCFLWMAKIFSPLL